MKARASQPVDDETAASIKAAKEASQSAATAAALSKEKPSKVAELTREKATVAPAVKEAREEAERKE